jgi:hypothetical protein
MGLATGALAMERLLSTLQVRSWTPDRLSSLRSALDPDGDGWVLEDDYKALVDWTRTAAEPEACAPSSSLSAQSMAISTRVAERVPEFVQGKAPPKQSSARYYFRPEEVAGDDLDSHGQDVFERCASQCLARGDECWMFSINVPHRSCSLHTKLWGFTSISV